MGDATRFPTPQHILKYAINRLEGAALNQLLPYVQNDNVNLADLAALVRILEDAFGDPDRVATAERELEKLQQKNREFSAYYADFQRLIAEVQWNDHGKRYALSRGLSSELKAALVAVDEPQEFPEYVRMLQRVDNKVRAIQAEQKGRGPQQTQRAPAPRAAPAQSASAPHPTDTGARNYGPAPMDLSAYRSKLSPEERAMRIQEGRCLYCGGFNHLARDCPNKRAPRPPLRASEAQVEVVEEAGKD